MLHQSVPASIRVALIFDGIESVDYRGEYGSIPEVRVRPSMLSSARVAKLENALRRHFGSAVEFADDAADRVFVGRAEKIGFAVETLFAEGALDVTTAPLGMKKNRPGTKICVLADADRLDETAGAVFRLTTTVGIRYAKMDRMVMDRETVTEETPDGSVRIKQCSGYGVTRRKAEYEDLARIARENGISLAEARKRTEE